MAVVGWFVLALAAPAWAHTELLSTSPADKAELTASVSEVTLTFSGPVRADGSTVTVTGPDGRSHSDGALSVVDFVVHQPVTNLTSGAYRVDWVVVAADGHAMSGQFTFQLSLPEPTAPTTTPAPAESESTTTRPTLTATATLDEDDPDTASGSSVGWWPWLVAAILLLSLVIWLGVRWARRRSASRTEGP